MYLVEWTWKGELRTRLCMDAIELVTVVALLLVSAEVGMIIMSAEAQAIIDMVCRTLPSDTEEYYYA